MVNLNNRKGVRFAAGGGENWVGVEGSPQQICKACLATVGRCGGDGGGLLVENCAITKEF